MSVKVQGVKLREGYSERYHHERAGKCQERKTGMCRTMMGRLICCEESLAPGQRLNSLSP